MRRFNAALIAFILAGLGVAAASEKADKRLQLSRVATPGASWEGPQFVRADRSGRVFLLRGDKLEVYSIGKDGAAAKPLRLETASDAIGHLLHAAMSPSGDQWLMYAEGKVRLFVDGKEKALPPVAWQPWTVGFLRDTPAVAVMPRPLPSTVLHLQDLGDVPWLVTLDNDRWSALVEHSGLSAEKAWKERSRMNEWVAEHASYLAPARDGKLWVASQYRYRLRRLSPMGRTLSEIVLEKEQKKASGRPAANREAAATLKSMEAHGGKATFTAFTEKPVIADVVEGPDALYLLIHEMGGGLALDRYDAVLDGIERVRLSHQGSGRFTLASGKDGLYIAPLDPAEGLWKISWSALESVAWEKVEEPESKTGR
jgi:hypothetical protein